MPERAKVVRKTALPFVGLATAVVIGGCGGLDVGKAEQNIKNGIEAQGGMVVKSVSCPSNVKKKEGEKFQCTAVSGDGKQLAVQVTETDGSGGIAWQTSGAGGQQLAATGPSGPSGSSGPSTPATSGRTTGTSPATPASKEPLVLRFTTFRNRSAGYSLDRPAHWKQQGTGKDLSFAFAARFMHVVSFKGGPQTPAVVRKGVTQDKRTVSHGAPKTVHVPAGDAVTIEFSSKNGATTTRIRRYSISGGGKLFLIDFGFGQNRSFDARFQRVINRAMRTFRVL